MSTVSIRGMSKQFSPKAPAAVADLNLEVADGEFVTLLGPSGCGKTTTLRCLAGLETPTHGEIKIGDRTVFSSSRAEFVPPEKRGIGMVFQSYALWPHMTVNSTVGYPLRLAKVPSARARAQITEMLERVHLLERRDDPAVSLSGGQQQRVSLARALVNRSSLVLFDEPLSNLDVKLRNSMRVQIRELHDELGTTSVYVTHDQEEAIALADRVVVMNLGRVEQVGTPRELYSKPINAFVADFMGFQNILPATVVGGDEGGALVELDGIGTRLKVNSDRQYRAGDPLLVAFRGSHVQVEAGEPGASSLAIRGRIRNVTYLGSVVRVLVEAGETLIRTQIDEREFGNYGPDELAVGRPVSLNVAPDHVVALPAPGTLGHSEPLASTMANRVQI